MCVCDCDWWTRGKKSLITADDSKMTETQSRGVIAPTVIIVPTGREDLLGVNERGAWAN